MVEELNLPEKTFKDKLFDFLTLNKEEIDNIELDYEKIPYVFGSHFSNPAYVSRCLTRLFLFTLTAIEIHTFDALDRLFINLNKTFDSVTSQKNDLREIIPEFFFLCLPLSLSSIKPIGRVKSRNSGFVIKYWFNSYF